jgi:DNA repair protein RecN (Recombination protein N)
MLRGLSIRDILLIDRLDLEFQPGLNVLTGETGAGKSILLDSLGVVLGWRGRGDVVRSGAEQGEVVADFDLPAGHPGEEVLSEAGLVPDGELVLRRTSGTDGRKQGYVNDRRVSGEVLRQLSDRLVELHGQHDDRGLLNPRGHRDLLDAFAGLDADVAKVREAWRAMAAARKALETRRAKLAKQAEERDFLAHAVGEMEALAPEPGEDASLDTRRRLMQASERIRGDITKAFQALGREGAEGLMGDARRWLEGAGDKAEGQLDEALAALERAAFELDSAQRGVETCLDALAFDPGELEQVEERLFALRALARKHGVQPDDLADLAVRMRENLGEIDSGAADVAALEAALTAAEASYDSVAKGLTAARSKAAKRLDTAMARELAPLKMERARFMTELTEGEAGPDGADQVQFLVATNPGAPSGPLNKIASGGELSRFLLALKVCLSARAEGLTMIFDEIDRGVGGATADAVGRRLVALADGGQVLVVTHSPQVAALGAHHWVVEKSVTGGQTRTVVRKLDGPERVAELARMLAGDTVTDAARAAAQALLNA